MPRKPGPRAGRRLALYAKEGQKSLRGFTSRTDLPVPEHPLRKKTDQLFFSGLGVILAELIGHELGGLYIDLFAQQTLERQNDQDDALELLAATRPD